MQLVIAEKPSVAQSIAKVIGATRRKDGYCTLTLSADNKTLELWKSNESTDDMDIRMSEIGQVVIPISIASSMELEEKRYLRLELVLCDDVGTEHPRKIIISKKMPGCTECGAVITSFRADPLICDGCVEKGIFQHMNPRCLDGQA